jgi:ribosomal 30S subunit maturation factor RimM
MFAQEGAHNLTGATAYDQAGQKIGRVATVYRDEAAGGLEWLRVKTGLFGMKETFVPLPRARAWTSSLANLAIAPVARPTEEVS